MSKNSVQARVIAAENIVLKPKSNSFKSLRNRLRRFLENDFDGLNKSIYKKSHIEEAIYEEISLVSSIINKDKSASNGTTDTDLDTQKFINYSPQEIKREKYYKTHIEKFRFYENTSYN